MSLIKKSEWPSLKNTAWLSDFFDNGFFDSDLLRNQTLPAVNVKETEKTYELELAAPGLAKRDFKVTADNGILTISSEKEEKSEEKIGGYARKEFSYSAFTRSFTLPENTNNDEIKARYEDGILKLTIAKKETAVLQARKPIEVK